MSLRVTTSMGESGKHLVVTVHGIRTFGEWQNRLAKLVRRSSVKAENYNYGFFSSAAFYVPMLRHRAVKRFRAKLLDLMLRYPGHEFSFVAHSFGTHIVGHGLAGLTKEQLPPIRTVLLAGSVLDENFNWTPLLLTGKLQRIINDCGIEDNILLLSRFVVPLTGMAGRAGFKGFTNNETLVNRFYHGGHSHYFDVDANGNSGFMKAHWLPLLVNSTFERSDDQGKLTLVRGLVAAFLPIATPVKFLFFLLIFGTPTYFGAVKPRAEKAAEVRQRLFESAAQQLSNDATIAQATATLAMLAHNEPTTAAGLATPPMELVRFGLMRLTSVFDALATLPDRAVFWWRGHAYLKGGTAHRLSIPNPIAYVPLNGSSDVMVFEQEGRVAVISAKGKVRWEGELTHEQRFDPPPNAWFFVGNRYVLFQARQYTVAAPGNDGEFWLADLKDQSVTKLDLLDDQVLFEGKCDRAAVQEGAFRPLSSDQQGLVFVPGNIYGRLEPSDSDAASPEEAQPTMPATDCALASEVSVVKFIDFPHVNAEVSQWSLLPRAAASESAKADGQPDPYVNLTELSALGVNSLDDLDFSTGIIAGSFAGSTRTRVDSPGMIRRFYETSFTWVTAYKGYRGQFYLNATPVASSNFGFDHFYCKLSDRHIKGCVAQDETYTEVIPSYVSESGRYRVLTDGRLDLRVADLSDMSLRLPDQPPRTNIIDTYISDREAPGWFAALSPMPGTEGGYRLTAYTISSWKLGGGPALIRSQVIPGPPLSLKANAVRPRIIRSEHSKTMAVFVPPHALYGFRVDGGTLIPAWSLIDIGLGDKHLQLSANPTASFFAAYTAEGFRLIDFDSGRLITKVIELTELGASPLNTITINADESVDVMSEVGAHHRAPPIQSSELNAIKGEFLDKLGIPPDELDSSDPMLLRTKHQIWMDKLNGLISQQ